MSKIKKDSFITIYSWMVTDLELKGNDLLIYAIIYGFSQGENQTFNGSLQYLADWCRVSKRTVITVLKSLCDKNLIIKKEKLENNVKACEYRCQNDTSSQNSLMGYSNNLNGGSQNSLMGYSNNLNGGSQNSLMGYSNNLNGGGEKISPNNIYNNISNNIEDNIEDIYCTERLENHSMPAIELPLNDKTLYPVYNEQVEEWKELYPKVDVMQELRKMKGWLNANPTRRKTKRGILSFINSWLSKEQDNGRTQPTKNNFEGLKLSAHEL